MPVWDDGWSPGVKFGSDPLSHVQLTVSSYASLGGGGLSFLCIRSLGLPWRSSG